MIRSTVVAFTLMAGVAAAQESGEITVTPLEQTLNELFAEDFVDKPFEETVTEESEAIAATKGVSAVLRGLDRVDGNLDDITLSTGETKTYERLQITLSECRYPTDNPAGDAYAFLTIFDSLQEKKVFEGWMIASSPALNAMDHSRYDVWVLRCNTE